jgi:hypothetical protein
MGGGMIPGLHEEAFGKIQAFFQDAADLKYLDESNTYRQEWTLTDKPTKEKYTQEFIISKGDINAYLAWRDNKGMSNIADNIKDFFGDFMLFWGGASLVGINMSKISPVIRTTLPLPHRDFKEWILDGYSIMHYNKFIVWNDNEKIFSIKRQTPAQRYKDLRYLENLESEVGHSITHHEINTSM